MFKAASLEQLSSHPTAQALIQEAKERRLGNLAIPVNFHEIAGAGVEGDINGEHIVIGSQSLFENRYEKRLPDERRMIALVGVNDKPVGVIVFGDQIRPGIASMMQRLRSRGIKQTIMLTGDSFENDLSELVRELLNE